MKTIMKTMMSLPLEEECPMDFFLKGACCHNLMTVAYPQLEIRGFDKVEVVLIPCFPQYNTENFPVSRIVAPKSFKRGRKRQARYVLLK